MIHVDIQLQLPETASDEIERLLASQSCPVHTMTTLDGGVCDLCELDAMLRRPARLPEWVQRAVRGELPAKVVRG